MKTAISSVIVLVLLLVTVSFVSAGTICESEINGVKYFTNKPNCEQNSNKSWPEIKFDAKANSARLASDEKSLKDIRKEEQLDIQRLKLKLEAKRIRALDNLKYYRPYIFNKFNHRPRYYRTKWLSKEGVYVYPDISSRQRHRYAGYPLFWR